MPAGSELKRLKAEYPELEIETVEVTIHPVRAWKDGVSIFPTIKIGDDVLSGIFLTRERVRRFVEEHLRGESK